MNDLNGILCFLNELDSTDRIDDDHLEKLRCVKQRLVIDFEDYNLSKIIHALNIVNESFLLFITNKHLDSCLEKTNSLRELKFYLISFKHFVNNVD